jgi:DNA-binding transcriptional MocR family regulator
MSTDASDGHGAKRPIDPDEYDELNRPPGDESRTMPAATPWFQGHAVRLRPRGPDWRVSAGTRQLMPSDRMLVAIVDSVEEPTARGIAAGISRLVSSGRLEAGARLPTVRTLARRLRVSPTTVSQAWQSLTRVGVVSTKGRSGTFVRGGRVIGASRTIRTYESPGGLPIDLSTGTPDPALLPNVSPILAKVSGAAVTTSYIARPVLPELEEQLLSSWPFPPERLSVVNGAMDALDRVTAELVRFGSRVLVENPCFPPLLDLLELVGAETIPIPLDSEGPVLDAVVAALPLGPSVFYLQPRAQNPTGINLTEKRAQDLAALLGGTRIVIVEDDHAGDMATTPLVSMGSYLPRQIVHIRGFSKTYGPDLRLAALGGTGSIIEAVDARRLLGPAWTSRLLQAVLVELLVDPTSVAKVAEAKEVYAERRERMKTLLAERGVKSSGNDGINLWIEVPHEQLALVTLAAAGVGASPGSSFEVTPLRTDHLRATVGLVSSQAELVANAFADAAVAGGARMTVA